MKLPPELEDKYVKMTSKLLANMEINKIILYLQP